MAKAIAYEVRGNEGGRDGVLLDVVDEAQDAYAYLELHDLSGHAGVWAVLDDGTTVRLPG